MFYYDSTNYSDPYNIYFTSSVNQEPIKLIKVTNEEYKWETKYKSGLYAIDTGAFKDYPDQSYENYNKIKNNRLNKPDKEKNELLSWIDNK